MSPLKRFSYALITSAIVILAYVDCGCVLALERPQQDVFSDVSYTIEKVEPGDRCLVSGMPLNENDIVISVLGRRVPLKKQALDIFLASPDKYFAKLQPKSALFTEDMPNKKRASYKLFYFGIYVFLGLIFAALSAHLAVNKGLAPYPWFFAGLATNVFGYFALLAVKSRPTNSDDSGFVNPSPTTTPMICPHCGFENHPLAKKCSGCSTDFMSDEKSETERI